MKDKRTTYKRVASTAEDITLACCKRCEWCDIRLTRRESADYHELGSKVWRDAQGAIKKDSADNQRLICTRYGHSVSGKECCPKYLCAREQWV